ncbi:MAG TPA: hypothetical protein VMV97_06675 [Sulfuriferula sp.]|nr:hypothetical protein [Sulfuriferula sp.]
MADILARHMFTPIPVESFLKPYTGLTTQDLPFLKAIEPAIVLQMLLPVIFVELPAALSNVLRFGYCVVSPSLLERVFALWLPSLVSHLRDIAPVVEWSRSYEEWRYRCNELAPGVWPFQSGGFIRESETAVMLDVTASSRALISRAMVDRTDFDLSNLRGYTFESQVQCTVDDSLWRPDATLAALRGRTLRCNGLALTDIDAIGARNGALLLISCKSVIYDTDYDKGTYRVIENVQFTVDGAVAKWVNFVDNLKENPLGDNFDLSRYTEIIGIVCTPFVVYSDNRATLDFAKPGLRRCVAAYELREWLEDKGAAP